MTAWQVASISDESKPAPTLGLDNVTSLAAVLPHGAKDLFGQLAAEGPVVDQGKELGQILRRHLGIRCRQIHGFVDQAHDIVQQEVRCLFGGDLAGTFDDGIEVVADFLFGRHHRRVFFGEPGARQPGKPRGEQLGQAGLGVGAPGVVHGQGGKSGSGKYR